MRGDCCAKALSICSARATATGIDSRVVVLSVKRELSPARYSRLRLSSCICHTASTLPQILAERTRSSPRRSLNTHHHHISSFPLRCILVLFAIPSRSFIAIGRGRPAPARRRRFCSESRQPPWDALTRLPRYNFHTAPHDDTPPRRKHQQRWANHSASCLQQHLACGSYQVSAR